MAGMGIAVSNRTAGGSGRKAPSLIFSTDGINLREIVVPGAIWISKEERREVNEFRCPDFSED